MEVLPFPVEIYLFEIFTRATPASSLVAYICSLNSSYSAQSRIVPFSLEGLTKILKRRKFTEMPGYDLIWHHQQVLSTYTVYDLHDPKQRRREVRLLFGSREVVYLSLEAETPANCSCMTTIFTYSYGALKVDTDNLSMCCTNPLFRLDRTSKVPI